MSGYIGAPMPRREDARLLTGQGTFVDDLDIPGVLHAAMVRSHHAHARIRGFDTARANALPGVHAIVTASMELITARARPGVSAVVLAGEGAELLKPWPARMPSPVPGTTLYHG